MFFNEAQKTKRNIIFSFFWLVGYFIVFVFIFQGVRFNSISLILLFVVPIIFGWFKIWNVKTLNVNYLKKIGPFLRNAYNTPGLPKTVFWFQVYCLITVLINFLFLLFLVVFGSDGYSLLVDVIGDVGGLIFSVWLTFALYIPPLVLPRKHWVWIFNLTVLSISVFTIILIPIVVPLIVLYTKPEVRKFYKS